jgi:hypothetical protein
VIVLMSKLEAVSRIVRTAFLVFKILFCHGVKIHVESVKVAFHTRIVSLIILIVKKLTFAGKSVQTTVQAVLITRMGKGAMFVSDVSMNVKNLFLAWRPLLKNPLTVHYKKL